MGTVVTFRVQGETLERLDIEANSLDEVTLKTPHGVYTVFRVFPGHQVVRLEPHLARLRHSAELLGIAYPLTDRWLRGALRRAVEASGIDAPRIRLTVPFEAPEEAIIAVEFFALPPTQVYEMGVQIRTVDFRRELPRAKNSRFIEKRGELRDMIRAEHPDMYELMMADSDGVIYEGISSNFYAVLDRELRTADDGVLEGVTRSIVLELAPEILPVRLEPIHRSDVTQLSEAMLTSASRGVIPIVGIDGIQVGEGVPGPIYRALRERYEARIAREMEPL